MKSLYVLLKDIRNLLPYMALISLYFFFVNIEAKKNNYSQQSIENEKMIEVEENKLDKKIFRVEIPVIPYRQ